MRVYENAIEMIGKTPMLHLHRFDTGPCELFQKKRKLVRVRLMASSRVINPRSTPTG